MCVCVCVTLRVSVDGADRVECHNVCGMRVCAKKRASRTARRTASLYTRIISMRTHIIIIIIIIIVILARLSWRPTALTR